MRRSAIPPRGGTGALARLGACAALLCALASAGVAMDLREMPPWLRAMVEPVHLGAAAEVETVQVEAPGTPMPAPAVGIGAGAETVGVSAPGAAPISVGGGLSLEAWGTPGAGAVHAPGMGGPAGPAPVSISAAAQDWSEAVGSIQGLSQEDLAVAGRIVSMLRETPMTEEQFVAWANEHGATPGALSAAYRMLTREKPYWNGDARVVCAALATLAGERLERLADIPIWGRPGLAIVLGLMDREHDARRVVASIPTSESRSVWNGAPEYVVASVLFQHDKALRTAIWAWKRGAARLGPADRALVCLELKLACRRIGQPALVREELIPWAEEALAMPGSEGEWDRALPALLWAYRYVGEPSTAMVRGNYWLARAQERGVPSGHLPNSSMELARVLASIGQTTNAAAVLREIAADGTVPRRAAVLAQRWLLELASGHEGIGDVRVLESTFTGVRPSRIRASLRAGEEMKTGVVVSGNATFEVTRAACDLPSAQVTVAPARGDVEGCVYEVELTVRSLAPGTHEATIILKTNATGYAEVSVPIALRVWPSIMIEPDTCFFGYVRPDETATWVGTVSCATPFVIVHTDSDDPQTVEPTVAASQGGAYMVTLRFHAPQRRGVMQGNVTLLTDVPSEPRVALPYYAHVSAPE